MSYAVIGVGGKQYVVREGDRLLVDRLPHEEGALFQPQVLLAADGDRPSTDTKLAVSARIVRHTRGQKLRIGKYKKRTGYRRHTGFRAELSQIQIESIGKAAARKAAEPKA